jgi:hypothetical protein
MLPLDLKSLTTSLKSLHRFKFKYGDGKVAREMFDIGDFIFSPDLKSAYHHIVIFEEHQQY